MQAQRRTHRFGDQWEFSYRIDLSSRTSNPEDAEENLRDLLAYYEKECQSLRRRLVKHCRSAGRVGDALVIAKEFLNQAHGEDERCEALFLVAHTMQFAQDWELAIGFYVEARECGTRKEAYPYFIENNIGYCLIQLGRFAEAQECLKRAIGMAPAYPHAHRNLGVSYEGLQHFSEAASAYVDAIRADAADPSALQLLTKLIVRHPGVLKRISDLEEQVIRCRAAVAYAQLEWEKDLQNSTIEAGKSEMNP
jgi:tetratricopeptide (TPR) repeat protein